MNISHYIDVLLQPRVLWTVLWCGFALLTFAMALLAQTRWGQGKTIGKCMILSVLAHVLLLGYAYTTQLFFDAPGPGKGDDPFEVALLDATEDAGVQSESQSTEPTRARPWEVTSQELPDLPEPPEHQPIDIPAETKPLVQPSTTFEDPGPTLAEKITSTPLREISNTPPAPADPLFAPSPADALAEHIKSQPRFIEQPPLPPPPKPSPEVPFERPIVPDRSVENIAGQSDQGGNVQRLANTPLPTDMARAVPDRRDHTPRADNLPGTDARFTSYPAGSAARSVRQPAAQVSRRRINGTDILDNYRNRFAENRASIAKHYGGDAQTEQAVRAALLWLVKNQQKDGSWNPRATGAGREAQVAGHNRSGAGSSADSGVSALAVLALMGAGHTHLHGEHRLAVQRGLEYLLRIQRSNGNLSGGAQLYAAMYCHAMATLALSEAYATTGDTRLKPAVRKAIGYTIAAQHPVDGGWRYRPGDVGDMSQFGWQVMSLRSAELAGIAIPERTEFGMRRFLRKCSAGRHYGLASYRPGERPSPSMTAEALACRYFLDTARTPEAVREATGYLAAAPPAAGRPNYYYWYYGALSLHQTQSPQWRQWNRHLKGRLLSLQEKSGANAGSWPPESTWGSHGGRVYSTALGALCLEVYYRYLPLSRQ